MRNVIDKWHEDEESDDDLIGDDSIAVLHDGSDRKVNENSQKSLEIVSKHP